MIRKVAVYKNSEWVSSTIKDLKKDDCFRLFDLEGNELFQQAKVRYWHLDLIPNAVAKGDKIFEATCDSFLNDFGVWTVLHFEKRIKSIKEYVNEFIDNAWNGQIFSAHDIQEQLIDKETLGVLIPADGTITRYIQKRKQEKGDVFVYDGYEGYFRKSLWVVKK
jgi:hypothetical protein